MSNKDLYEILGVPKGSNPDQIKKAYRSMANKYHPDKNPDNPEAEAKFKEVSNAYETLSDPQKKQMYDQFGHAGANMGGQGQGGGFGGGYNAQDFDFSGFGGIGDIFETFFNQGSGGGQSRQSKKQRQENMPGEDLEMSMRIKFEEAAFGVQKTIKLRRVVACEQCKATGAEPGSKVSRCQRCEGSGMIKEVKRTILGQIVTNRECDTCRGEGQIAEQVCRRCTGQKRHAKEETVKVAIPQGVDDGAVIRLRGKGNEGLKKGNEGDLYIHLSVEPSTKYTRQDFDVLSVIELHILQVTLGDEVEIETIHGKETLVVPPGTQPGKVFRLKSKGVPKMNSGDIGDHLVTVNVYVPKKINKSEREMYLKLVEEAGLKIKPGKSGLLW
jgi:molecular chaperone DnaJ